MKLFFQKTGAGALFLLACLTALLIILAISKGLLLLTAAHPYVCLTVFGTIALVMLCRIVGGLVYTPPGAR